jgi:tetratricopeptide (TPR) repeat protein
MVNGDQPRADTRGVEQPVSLDPGRAFARAEAFEREGRYPEAESIYRSLLRVLPSHPAVLTNLALTVKARGNLTEAETLLRQAIAAAPREPIFHNNLGNTLRAQGRFADAEAFYRQAIALKENYPEAHYNLGIALDDQGRVDEALAAFRKAVSINPGYAQALTQIGAIGFRNKRHDAALIELDKAVALNPNHFDAHYYRGLVLSALGQYDDAVAALQRASVLKPDSLELAMAMANALRSAGRNDEALTAYWRLLEKQPGRVATHDDINSFAWSIGRKDIFLKSFAYARDLSGEKPELLLHEGAFRLRANEGEEAERLLKRAGEMAPERADVSGMLARALAYNRKYSESFPHFTAAIARDPGAMGYRHEFGFALLNDNQPKEALRVLEEARALDATDQLTLAGLALAYRELGDSRYGALVDFERHVRMYEIRLPQGFADARAFNEMLADELKRLHTSKVEPIDQSLRNGTQTMGDLFDSNAFAIRQVHESISEAVANYIKQMPADAAHPLFGRKDENFTYSGSWSCQLRSSGYHANHVHPKGWISSAYYVHLPDAVDDEAHQQGWLKFGESNLALGSHDRPEHHVRPIVGHLVLFPSYYWHGTVPFTASDERLGIAFDVVPGLPGTQPQGGYSRY